MLKKMWWLPVALLAASGCAAPSSEHAKPAGAIAIQVTEKGFEPAEVRVAPGRPVTLVVTRRTDRTCAKEFVMADQNIRRDLPLNQPVEITFTPSAAGELRYACGMDMISGKIIVQ
jgi:plastocyanin domain-containing protein